MNKRLKRRTKAEQFFTDLEEAISNSYIAYLRYLNHGKKFTDAESIKAENLKIKNLIKYNYALLPREKILYASSLLDHINIWLKLWEKAKNDQQPHQLDKFCFENDATFPRDDVAMLLAK